MSDDYNEGPGDPYPPELLRPGFLPTRPMRGGQPTKGVRLWQDETTGGTFAETSEGVFQYDWATDVWTQAAPSGLQKP